MTACVILDLPADRLETQVVIAPLFQNEKPLKGCQALLDWRLNGLVTYLLEQKSVAGKTGERILINGGSKIAASWVLFLGVGVRKDPVLDQFERFLTEALVICRQSGFSRIGLCFSEEADLCADKLQEKLQARLKGSGYAGMEFFLSTFNPALHMAV